MKKLLIGVGATVILTFSSLVSNAQIVWGSFHATQLVGNLYSIGCTPSVMICGYWGTISTTGQKAFLVEKTKEVWVVQSASVNPDGSGISGVGELASPDAEFVDNTTN